MIDVSSIEQNAPNSIKFLLDNTGSEDLKTVIVRINGDDGAANSYVPVRVTSTS